MNRRFFLRSALAGSVLATWAPSLSAQPPKTSPMDSPNSPPIIDSHQHIWDLKQFNLPWLAKAGPKLNQSFGVDDFERAAEGLNVQKTVYIEVDVHPEQTLQEAALAVKLCADPSNPIAGAVIGGDPRADGFGAYVERFAGDKCIKGVRMVLHTPDRPPGTCLEPRFVESMTLLGKTELSFDLCMRRDELLTGAQLVAKCPQTQFVLDHCGGIGGAKVDPKTRKLWREGIKAIAGQENVVCKISGLVDELMGEKWTADDLAETVHFCCESFGEDRVLFGGDWPVCLLGGTYKRWVEALRTLVADQSETARRKLFHDNAARIYRLG